MSIRDHLDQAQSGRLHPRNDIPALGSVIGVQQPAELDVAT